MQSALFVLVLVMSARAFADDGKRVMAVRASGAIHVDGHLTEPAWTNAPRHQGFWQLSPHEGDGPEQDTMFQVVYDDDALYVGVRAFDAEPAKVRGVLTRRDQDSASDWITVSIDSYGDRRTAFTFSLNPAGVQHDTMVFDDTKEDVGWDAVWEGATSIDDQGWIAEYRIPYTQLRFAPHAEQNWRMQVQRYVHRTQEVTYWTAVPSDRDQLVSLFAPVGGIAELASVRRLELVPYAIGGVGVADTADPLAAAGLDVKYGLASNFTLTGAINPDFRQVEADPSEVNLTDRETYYAEKRPFFLEGADILRFGLTDGAIADASEQMLYTRRIGAAPHIDVGSADRSTTIYGAAALSGKTAGGLSVGALSVVTAEERRMVEVAPGMVEDTAVEPLTSYNVLRIGRDANGGRTSLGAIATGVFRHLDGTGIDTLHDRALTGGLSLQHRSEGGAWTSTLKLLASDVHGSAAAIDLTQRASQHYFQRPDAMHLHYDPTREQLAGAGATTSTTFTANKHVRLASGVDARSPGLELNDLGFQRSADAVSPWGWLQYRDEVAGATIHRSSAELLVRGNWDCAPIYLGTRVDANAAMTLRNFWGVYAGAGVDADRLDTKLLRGGPATTGRDRVRGRIGMFSDERLPVRFQLEATGMTEPSSQSWQSAAAANVVIAPRSNVELALGPMFVRGRNSLQYVDTVVSGDGSSHYVLARVDQTIAALTLRAAYTISPRLSLQWYAQPFIAAGAYDRYQQAVAPRAASPAEQFASLPADVSVARPDFDIRELHSTFVTRWEYRPGSTLFVIWTHDRSSVDGDGTLRVGDDLRALAAERGTHTVLLKLSYWWTP
jgi:hypothetical protein